MKLWTMLVALAVLSAPLVAYGQGDAASAQVLFDEARKLMDAGDVAAACPKLEDSYRLDPALGTLLNLAVCLERQGKTASAWARFVDALAMAEKARDVERAEFAITKRDALAPKLNRLTVVVEGDIDAVVVTRNGVELGVGTYDTALPVDPGTHVIEANKPGHAAWSMTVTIRGTGQSERVVVPPFGEGSIVPDPEPVIGDGTEESSPWPGVGWTFIGIGGAGIVVGGIFGVRAIVLAGDANDACDPQCTSQADVDTNEDAKTSALLSNVFIGVGAGLAAAGVLTVILTSDDDDAALSVSPMIHPTLVGGAFAARF